MTFQELFHNEKPVIGMIHTNHGDGLSVLELAQREVEIYLKNGIYPLIENYFGSTDDCEEVLKWMQKAHSDSIYGVNILGDYEEAFELADEYGARFIQIDSVCGHLEPNHDEEYEDELKWLRKRYPNIAVFGGVRFKYQAVRSGRTTSEDLRIGMVRCDAIVCTGEGTGIETPLRKVEKFKTVVRNFPVIVGAGVTLEHLEETLTKSDGVIVGSWFKHEHDVVNTVCEKYVEDFMEVASACNRTFTDEVIDKPEPCVYGPPSWYDDNGNLKRN